MVSVNEATIKLARQEFARSFDPREWYERDDDHPEDRGNTEAGIMWVYRLIAGAFVVGFFTPAKEWVEESRHPTGELAASRVHWLNGGGL